MNLYPASICHVDIITGYNFSLNLFIMSDTDRNAEEQSDYVYADTDTQFDAEEGKYQSN